MKSINLGMGEPTLVSNLPGLSVCVERRKDGISHDQYVSSKIKELINSKDHFDELEVDFKCNNETQRAVYFCDLGDVLRKVDLWYTLLPRVEPFYAVKCNNDMTIVKIISEASNGSFTTGFDCASKAEINQVLSIGVDPNRIVFANPCKMKSHIRHAAAAGVEMMTFDCKSELDKMKLLHPNAQLIIRLRVDDKGAQCELGMKFGCEMEQVEELLRYGQQLKLNIIGVSFHVGSGCRDASAFETAIESARTVFDMAETLGNKMHFLDIGGGFPGDFKSLIGFEEFATVIRDSLELHFPPESGVRIIAEPGRYFVSSAFTLCTEIIAKKDPSETGNGFMYYINDGVYGSFNCVLYDHASVDAKIPNSYSDNKEKYEHFTSSIWGPTCDGLDRVQAEAKLPEMFVGEWLVFDDMGAYTLAAGSGFNGMPKALVRYHISDCDWHRIMKNQASAQYGEEATSDLDVTDQFDIVSQDSGNSC